MTKFRQRIEALLERGHGDEHELSSATTPPGESAMSVDPAPLTNPVIDLSDAGLIAQRALVALDAQRCSNCGGTNRLELLDDVAHIAVIECSDCGVQSQHRLRQTLQTPTLQDRQPPVVPNTRQRNRLTFS